MAWPPPTLPINRTDATAQQGNHIADHNGANLAINDTVTKVKSIDSWLQIVNARVFPSITLGSGNVDAASATLADWVTVGGVAIPAGVRLAFIQTAVSGIFESSGDRLPSSLRLRVGSLNGFTVPVDGQGPSHRFVVAWGDSLAITGPQTVIVAVQAARPGGGALRFDTACRATFDMQFLQ